MYRVLFGRSSRIDPSADWVFVATHLPILLGGAVGAGDLVTHAVVLAGQTLGLLLKVRNIAVLGLKLLLQAANLASVTSPAEGSRVLLVAGGLAAERLDLLLEAQDIEDHDVGAVENQRQEQGEAAEIHVALRVEFAGLHLHALRTANDRSPIGVTC